MVSGFGFKSKMLQSEMEVIREKDSRLSFSSDEDHSPIYPDALNSLQSFRRKGSNPLIKQPSVVKKPSRTEVVVHEKTINQYTVRQLLSEVNYQVQKQLEVGSVKVQIPGFGLEISTWGKQLLKQQNSVKKVGKQGLRFQEELKIQQKFVESELKAKKQQQKLVSCKFCDQFQFDALGDTLDETQKKVRLGQLTGRNSP